MKNDAIHPRRVSRTSVNIHTIAQRLQCFFFPLEDLKMCYLKDANSLLTKHRYEANSVKNPKLGLRCGSTVSNAFNTK